MAGNIDVHTIVIAVANFGLTLYFYSLNVNNFAKQVKLATSTCVTGLLLCARSAFIATCIIITATAMDF